MRYYSTQRPVAPGGYPGKGYVVEEIVNFDKRQFCEEIGREAWGYIDFDGEISEKDCSDYELVPACLKTYWAVTTAFFDDGRVISNITDEVKAAVKPENVAKSLRRKDLHIDWFESKEAAEQHVKDARNA